MSYNVPDFDESFERRINEEEAEELRPDECLNDDELNAFLDSLDADPMEAYKQMVERTED